jgi:hypothetical protein
VRRAIYRISEDELAAKLDLPAGCKIVGLAVHGVEEFQPGVHFVVDGPTLPASCELQPGMIAREVRLLPVFVE